MALSLRSTAFLLLLLCFFTLCNGYFHTIYRGKRHRPRVASHNYRDALTKSILYFEGQRSGRLPPNQRITWRRNSGLTDGAAANVDLVGGYYDAGDNVKFGFPMAFTTTMLSWSVIEFGGLMKGELFNARGAIRWATDYLLKATVHPGVIYVQVGEANRDHACWERPEDMDTPRNVYKIDKNTPGSDVAAETAAALAAASVVFRRSDPNYSKILARRAINVFQFADMYRAPYSNGLRRIVCPFYCSFSGYQDELLWGAAWLFKATRNPMYLRYIQINGQRLGAADYDNTFGWDNKHGGTRILLSKTFLVQGLISLHEYKDHADNFICSVIPGASFASSKFTPGRCQTSNIIVFVSVNNKSVPNAFTHIRAYETVGGLLYKLSDANMQYVTSTSFLLLSYAKYLTSAKKYVNCGGATVTPSRLRAIAKRQVDYLLGDNPLRMSYMVGYGTRYPLRIHHRGSSLPSIAVHPTKIQCHKGFDFMHSQSPNPNILVGAVVGGPDLHDRFPDQRPDYEQSEPCTYINAPLVGALAYLAHSFGQL